MLVTNVGGLPEIVPHGKIGYVVEPDANEIAKALIDFYENEREKEFEQNVKEEKRKYEWVNMIEAFDKLTKSIS
jgi:glycosyltransferase involved in cell wall biosynthesis